MTNLQSRSASLSTTVDDSSIVSSPPAALPSFGTKPSMRSASIGSSFFHKDTPNFFGSKSAAVADTSSGSIEEKESSSSNTNTNTNVNSNSKTDAVLPTAGSNDLDIVGAIGNLDLDDDFAVDSNEALSQGHPSKSTTPFLQQSTFLYGDNVNSYQFYHPHYPPPPHQGSLTPNPSLGGFAPTTFGASNTPSSTWNNSFIPSSAPPFTYNNAGNNGNKDLAADLPSFVKSFELPSTDESESGSGNDKNADKSSNASNSANVNSNVALFSSPFGGILDSQLHFMPTANLSGGHMVNDKNGESENDLGLLEKGSSNFQGSSPLDFNSHQMNVKKGGYDLAGVPPFPTGLNDNLSMLPNVMGHPGAPGGPMPNMWNQQMMNSQLHPTNMRNTYDGRGMAPPPPPQSGMHPNHHMMGQFNNGANSGTRGNSNSSGNHHNGRHRGNYMNDGMNVHRKMHNSINSSNGHGRRKGDDASKYANAKLSDFTGEIFSLCKDQHGCRFLQRQLDLGREVAEGRNTDSSVLSNDIAATMIFNEIYLKIVELMTDPFGNYLIQKLFENVSVDQRIILVKNAAPEFIRIALDPHGTRALQKLVECISTEEESKLIIGSLSPHIVSLSRDLNGNHVVQKCLQKLKPEENQFIFETASLHCNEIATHRHGCCVLQRCLDHGNSDQRRQLSLKVAENATNLSLDPFGNYVVQYVLSRGDEGSIQIIMDHIKSNIISLSLHKFGSNVIEKSLRINKLTNTLIDVLLKHQDRFSDMLNDAFGNYVLQTSLDVANPQDLNSLSQALQPLLPNIKNTPHGRRIMTKIQSIM